MRTAWDLMVMPRSRSISMRSRYWAFMSRDCTTPVYCSMRSARVDFPWSMCAMMQKFRMMAGSVAAGTGAVRAMGDTQGPYCWHYRGVVQADSGHPAAYLNL